MYGYSIKDYTYPMTTLQSNLGNRRWFVTKNYVSRFDTVHTSTERDRFRFKTDNSSKVSTIYTYITVPVG